MNFFGAMVPTFRFCVTILKKTFLGSVSNHFEDCIKICLCISGAGGQNDFFHTFKRDIGFFQIGTFLSLGSRRWYDASLSLKVVVDRKSRNYFLFKLLNSKKYLGALLCSCQDEMGSLREKK